jgi:hypothetical protein
LTDSYAAVRFDAWKSLRTLPGFSEFPFTYTAPEQTLREAATRAYEKWQREVRSPNAVYQRETAIDSDGRFRQDVFQRLRSARDEKPIFLAE